jgi:hypothetical protein
MTNNGALKYVQEGQIKTIFMNIKEIHSFHGIFLADLKKVCMNEDEPYMIGKAFIELV